MIRANVIETMNEDYVRTARAKGLAQGGVVLRHALSNALIPVATLLGLQVGTVLGGAELVERRQDAVQELSDGGLVDVPAVTAH